YDYTLPYKLRNPIVGLAWSRDDLYAVEIFLYDNQWSTETANLVKFDRRTGRRTTVLAGFASLPHGLVEGSDGALYTSKWGISFAPDDGQVLRIVPGAPSAVVGEPRALTAVRCLLHGPQSLGARKLAQLVVRCLRLPVRTNRGK